MKKLLFFLWATVLCVGVGIGAWKLERWINWKFDYGSRVEQRIRELDSRIEKLEKRP